MNFDNPQILIKDEIGNPDPEIIEPLDLIKTTPEIKNPDGKVISGDIKNETTVNDTNEGLAKVREELGLNYEQEKLPRKKWRAIRKPRNEYRQEREITTDSPFDRVGAWIKSFSKEEKNKKSNNLKVQEQFKVDRREYSEVEFDYRKGSGVEGWTSHEKGILAKGFYECSGLVIQTPDSVSIIHISPNIINDTSSGGEIVKDYDYLGHIRSALKEIIEKTVDAKKTGGDKELSKEEIQHLQKMIDSGELKTTMLLGEDNIAPIIPIELASGRNLDMPIIKTQAYYVGGLGGGGGHAIYANPKELYFIGADDTVMKKGSNFPPEMFSYEEFEKK